MKRYSAYIQFKWNGGDRTVAVSGNFQDERAARDEALVDALLFVGRPPDEGIPLLDQMQAVAPEFRIIVRQLENKLAWF